MGKTEMYASALLSSQKLRSSLYNVRSLTHSSGTPNGVP